MIFGDSLSAIVFLLSGTWTDQQISDEYKKDDETEYSKNDGIVDEFHGQAVNCKKRQTSNDAKQDDSQNQEKHFL